MFWTFLAVFSIIFHSRSGDKCKYWDLDSISKRCEHYIGNTCIQLPFRLREKAYGNFTILCLDFLLNTHLNWKLNFRIPFRYIEENYSKIRDVERELANLSMEMKLTAGPKRAGCCNFFLWWFMTGWVFFLMHISEWFFPLLSCMTHTSSTRALEKENRGINWKSSCCKAERRTGSKGLLLWTAAQIPLFFLFHLQLLACSCWDSFVITQQFSPEISLYFRSNVWIAIVKVKRILMQWDGAY